MATKQECIVIFATAWGVRYGGINSFNYDLCIALAKYLSETERLNLKVVCVVNEGDSNDIKEAQSFGVKICKVPHDNDHEIDKENVSDKLKGNNLNPLYMLGHDVHTGRRAINLAKHYSVLAAVFHHMDYRTYKTDQDSIKRQEKILEDSNLVFAVGPTLKNSASDITLRQQIPVIKILPGITERNVIESAPERFSAITLGRVNLENDLIKQMRLAVASFGQAVCEETHLIQEKNPILTVIGLSKKEIDAEDQQDSLQSLADQYAQRHVSLLPWSYEEKRENLFRELEIKTVCMVLSWYEGFSLIGLEAISVGVPLILSRNTGLYKAIEELLGGEGIGCLYEVDITATGNIPKNDLKQVVVELRKIAADPSKAKENAKNLRQKLLDKGWTWENTAEDVFSEIKLQIPFISEEVRSDLELLELALKQLVIASTCQSSHEANEMGTVIHIEDHRQSKVNASFEAIAELSRNYISFKEGSNKFSSCRRQDKDIDSLRNTLQCIKEAVDSIQRTSFRLVSRKKFAIMKNVSPT